MKSFKLFALGTLLLLSNVSFSFNSNQKIEIKTTTSLLWKSQKGEPSTRGNWSKADKKKAKAAVALVKKDIEEALGKQSKAYVKCYLQKVENAYPNFAAADSDEPGCTKLAEQCISQLNL